MSAAVQHGGQIELANPKGDVTDARGFVSAVFVHDVASCQNPGPVDVAPASQSIHPTHLPARLAIARRSVEISSAAALSPFAIIKAEENVIKVSVLYPNTAGCKFDMEYYRTRHMPMVQQKLGPACRRMAVEEGGAGDLKR